MNQNTGTETITQPITGLIRFIPLKLKQSDSKLRTISIFPKRFIHRSKYVAVLKTYKNLQIMYGTAKGFERDHSAISIAHWISRTNRFSEKGNAHAWSVYLMHAQVVQDCMRRSFFDKPF